MHPYYVHIALTRQTDTNYGAKVHGVSVWQCLYDYAYVAHGLHMSKQTGHTTCNSALTLITNHTWYKGHYINMANFILLSLLVSPLWYT